MAGRYWCALDNERELSCEMSRIFRSQAVSQRPQDGAKNMPSELLVWPDLIDDFVKPDVRHLNRFI